MDTPDAILAELEKIGKIEVIEKLHNHYSMSDKNNRLRILEILNQLEDDAHFEKIENYFVSDEDAEVRIEAAKVLAFNYKKSKAIKPLIWVLENEKRNDVKYIVLRLLVALAYQEEYRDLIVDTLKKMLKAGDDLLKMDSAESLGMLEVHSVVGDLIELLKSSNNKLVKIKAIQALGNIKSEKAVPLLVDHLGLDSFDVWRFSFDALRSILGDQRLIDLLLKGLDDIEEMEDNVENGLLKRGIIKALGELSDKRAIPQLISALKDYFYWVNEEAVDALDRIDSSWREEYKDLIRKKNIYV